MSARVPIVVGLLLAGLVAGCTSNPPAPSVGPGLKSLQVDSTTGGIRGVVVDQAIHPVKGAMVDLPTAHENASTGADGSFSFDKLAPGTYIVRASRATYDEVQTSVDVVAGVPDPKPVRIQLTRQISQDPYIMTTQFNGYIACSAGVPGVGYSEECGEGVGVPCTVPPPLGCQRVGGQGNNIVKNDFLVDSSGIKTIIVEQTWQPTTGTTGSGELYTLVATNFVCDPNCAWKDELGSAQKGSPILIRVDDKHLGAIQADPSIPITSFTWAGADKPNLDVDQPFQEFVTFFYWAEAPPGWSFVGGSPNPF
ncbi:MAG: carboxypeptidase-like regulatory domain-containing protein [Thermoplasmatota archaeon]